MPSSFSALKKRYSDNSRIQLFNCAISDQKGEVDFFCPRDGSSLSDQQKSGLSMQSLEKAGIATSDIQKISVEAKRISDVISESGIWPELVQIDAEGFDYQLVLQCLELERLPLAIHFETIHMPEMQRNDIRLRLENTGFNFFETETDTLALSKTLSHK
jgi:FkbM family methyltransferase